MPVDQIFSTTDSLWGIWKIQEDENTLAAEVPRDIPPDYVINPLKRREFFAGRVLIKRLLDHWELPYRGIVKDSSGKPFLADSPLQISLSHSYPYVAAILHRHKNVGIDLEQPKSKLLRIAPRILADTELADAGDNLVKHCIYWCAKESLIKIYGKKDLIFSKNLLIEPFEFRDSGILIGRIVAGTAETAIPLAYRVRGDFVVVVSQ